MSTPKEIALKILYDTPIPEGCDFEVNGIDQAKKVARYQAHIVSLIEKAIEAQLTLAPNEQVIRVPNTNSFLDECFNLVSDEYNLAVDIVTEHEEAIKRLNPKARIEESNE